MAVLALLMAGTSWAVASWVSAWLVPPYLILMALILSPSSARPQGESAEGGSDPSTLRPASPGEGSDGPEPLADDPASAGSPEAGSEQGTSTTPTRGRRGKGRARKAKPLPEPTEATWVQVAPGKFVRVEGAESPAEAGPHEPAGVPVEVPVTPQASEFDEGNALVEEPAEDAELAIDPVDGPEGDPDGGVESESPTALKVDETGGSSGVFEGLTAIERPDTDRLDVALEAFDDRGWAEPEGEGLEDSDDSSTEPEEPDPTEGLVLADVPPEEVDEEGATVEEADPTEITVDETAFDDAGPIAEVPSDLESPPVEDADSPETETFRGASLGSTWCLRRLAPRAGTRVGHAPRRAFGHESPPRRPVRSPGSARRLLDPRRPSRRGSGRPRQITRTFPPRSPPSLVSAEGRILPNPGQLNRQDAKVAKRKRRGQRRKGKIKQYNIILK